MSINGKTVLITGASAGIGLASARELAGQGATVVLTGRDGGRCADAAAAIRSAHPEASVDWLVGDLAVQADVRRIADEYRNKHEVLDVLINNAGTIEARASHTPEGVERTLAVNHLAPFLLTVLLAENLIAAGPARVVNVASVAHVRGRLDFDDLELRRYRPFRAYARSKLANLLFTHELARRLSSTRVTANAVNPGLVRTNLGRDGGFVQELGFKLTHLVYRRRSITPEEGADSVVFLASSPAVESSTGQYFYLRQPVASSPASHDAEAARRLWELSESWTGVSWSATPVR